MPTPDIIVDPNKADPVKPKTAEEIAAMIAEMKSPKSTEDVKLKEEFEKIKQAINKELTLARPVNQTLSEVLRTNGSEFRRVLNRYGVPPGDMDKCLAELSLVFDN